MERSTRPEDYQRVDRAVAAMKKEFPDGTKVAPHVHERAQLIFAVAGVMEINVREALWVVPPQRALWVPAEVEHGMVARGTISMRTLYIRTDALPFPPPADPVSIRVSPLLRELIIRSVTMPIHYDEDGRDGKIIDLILDEVEFVDDLSLRIQNPEDHRLRKLCDYIKENPLDNRPISELAADVGASTRTLTRLARQELGVPLLYWRNQVRLLEALPRLVCGEAITSVALSVGYETTSAFTAMFHRTMGKTPSQYVKYVLQAE